jgi:hypothetical protein
MILPVPLDLEKLKTACDAHKFRGLEREMQQAAEREVQDRQRKIEDARRAKEKRARRKRQKSAAQASS